MLKKSKIFTRENLGLGAFCILSVRTDPEKSPEFIRNRLLSITISIDDPRLILGTPDCGLRHHSLPVDHKFLKNIVQDAQ
ncbi:MAG: hypothetical protein ACFFC7_08860 [Candidatus Hermodarchaeota archaeon]